MDDDDEGERPLQVKLLMIVTMMDEIERRVNNWMTITCDRLRTEMGGTAK